MAKAATATVDTSGLSQLKELQADKANQTVARQPVTETGIALLACIKASPQGFLMLLQSEGAEIVAAGQAIVSGVPMADGTAPVSLTPVGEAILAASPTSERKSRSTVIVGAVRTGIAPPLKAKRGAHTRGSKYPFETMEIGESFHIAATTENPQPLAAIASSITVAREKFAVEVKDETGAPVMETVQVKTYQKGPDDKFVKDANGKRVVLEVKSVRQPKTQITRDFTAAAVDASDPDGVGARVWRIA